MLKTLQRAMGGEAAAALQTELASVQAEFAEFKQTAEALLAEAETHAADLKAQLEAANALVAEYRAANEQAEAAAKAAAEQAEAMRLNARKEKLVAAVGTERADALLKVAEGMNDAAFEAVVSALGTSAAAEEKSPLFKEVGAAAQADGAKVVEESEEMKILKAQYGQK